MGKNERTARVVYAIQLTEAREKNLGVGDMLADVGCGRSVADKEYDQFPLPSVPLRCMVVVPN